MSDLTNVDDPIRKFQAELQEASQKADRLRPLLRSCQDAIARCGAPAGISVRPEAGLRPSIAIVIFCERLEETVPLLRELAKEGLHTDKRESHTDRNLFNAIGMREYNLGPDLKVCAMLMGGNRDGNGKACRMVQTGVKEVPIYEVKCD